MRVHKWLETIDCSSNPNGGNDDGFSMRAVARVIGEGLTLASVGKSLEEEEVGWKIEHLSS